MAGRIEARLKELGITLPDPGTPVANYIPAVESRGMLYVSGQLPRGPQGITQAGKLGGGVSIEQGAAAARICAISILGQAKAALGDLDRIKRVVKVLGFVNSAPDFTDQPRVVNGASDLIVEVLGDAGRHARSAVGVASLPMGAAVEVEAIIEIA